MIANYGAYLWQESCPSLAHRLKQLPTSRTTFHWRLIGIPASGLVMLSTVIDTRGLCHQGRELATEDVTRRMNAVAHKIHHRERSLDEIRQLIRI